MSRSLMQGLGQPPALSHGRGVPSTLALTPHCRSRGLHQGSSAIVIRQQYAIALARDSLSGVARFKKLRSPFRGDAEEMELLRAFHLRFRDVAIIPGTKGSRKFVVVQDLNSSLKESYRPRGTFPAVGEHSRMSSSVVLQDSPGLKFDLKQGNFSSEQNIAGDRVSDRLNSKDGSSQMVSEQRVLRTDSGVHRHSSSLRSSAYYNQMASRVRLNPARGEEAVLRGSEDIAQRHSSRYQSLGSYWKNGQKLETSFLNADQDRNSQNGAHPPLINDRYSLPSRKQVSNPPLPNRMPSEGGAGNSLENRRVRDNHEFRSRVGNFVPETRVAWENHSGDTAIHRHGNVATLATTADHVARSNAVPSRPNAAAARWSVEAAKIRDRKSPFGVTSAQARSRPVELDADLEVFGGSVEVAFENLESHGGPHIKATETLEDNISQLSGELEQVASEDSTLQSSSATDDDSLDSLGSSNSRQREQRDVSSKVFVVNDVHTAKEVVDKLRGEYRGLFHACDTEVAEIDVKKESPVGHGRLICLSIYCGPTANFGEDKCRVWVDVLTEPAVLDVFKFYFEDANIKKIWHNYSFDKHILANHGINVKGFYADTMHLARLYDSARSVVQGGYSLEGLTSDRDIMNGHWDTVSDEEAGGKRSMKQLFGKANVKKSGEEGKLRVVPPVEELQMQPDSRDKWIQYSSFDTVCTWCLWKSLKEKLEENDWKIEGQFKQGEKKMYDFYQEYMRPFGDLLVQMEAEGMMLDRDHLARIEEIAIKQQIFSANEFRKWAAKRCPDAIYMNVGSDAQIRQLLFGGKENRNDSKKRLEMERVFSAPNTEDYVEDGKKLPKKTRPFTLAGLGVDIPVDTYTSAGWPAVGGAALKALAGKVAIDYTMLDEMSSGLDPAMVDDAAVVTSTGVKGGSDEDISVYGKAYEAFGGGQAGKEACMAFAALCEVASINTLISNFIQPLQGSDIKGPDGRVHCSLNINTETGRLSARRPSLQNQPALEKDRYKIRQAFVAAPGNSLIVADYGQLELRILAHLTNCKSMLKAFVDGGDFHSRTAMNMYPHVRNAVEKGEVLLEWDPKPGQKEPPVPLLKDVFGAERRKAKMLNFSIAYGKTAVGLSKDWKVSPAEAKATVNLWYSDRKEVLGWQEERKKEARNTHQVYTLLGRTRHFPDVKGKSKLVQGHMERAAINTPVQGSAADVAMCAMLEICRNKELQELGWKLILQVHDEVILEGPAESANRAKDLVVRCMSHPFNGKNNLRVGLAVDAKSAQSWYAAK